MKKIKWGKMAGAILMCEAVGGVGAVITGMSVKTWYVDGLTKPSFTPPSWLFAPVWTMLFLLMGIAVYLIWEKRGEWRWFGVQLGLNFLWSGLFFGLRWPLGALIDIGLLWVSIGMTMWEFAKKSRWAAGLLIPYILWVSFAAFLNLAIVNLN